MRLFVSIDFPDSILREIHTWIPKQYGWKKVAVYQMHLTLAFLGECSEKEKEKIYMKLSDIEFTPFRITVSGLGAFPNDLSPVIIWAGIQADEELFRLQKRISEELKDHIKSKHTDLYIPHITLAREKNHEGINHIVKKNLQVETGKVDSDIQSFQLKESILKLTGSEHHVIHHFEVKRPQ